MKKDYELINNTEERQYEFHIDDYVPRIEYMRSTNGEVYLTHTEVPPAIEGKGIASLLTEKTLCDIEQQGFRLIPLCPFVVDYIRKHPEWKRLMK
ncbi:MAG: N-acetyltransferase [Bacteroidales bacterium]|jgi:predicted GNAT family acetyltransferase|nr:N-acetyltransferase [Bacteroidales bacterium]